MSLQLYFHPLSSFCQKVLIALYENDTPFERHIVDLSDPASREAFRKIWPIGKFPVLRNSARDETIPESSIIIEYLARHYPGPSELMPPDGELARKTRLRDRFFDLYVQGPMQKIVGDRLRPAGSKDPLGVEQARAALETAYQMIDRELASGGKGAWAANVVVPSISAGQTGANGCRVVPASGSENETTIVRRSGATISRNSHLPHISRPSGACMP